MRRDILMPQHRVLSRRGSHVLAENIGDAIACQRLAVSIEKHALLSGAAGRSLQSVQCVGRLSPKRQQALLFTFATQTDLPGCSQLQIAPLQPQRFAGAGTTVVQK
jgi:hypothetical protein